jgi:hypothetical protein
MLTEAEEGAREAKARKCDDNDVDTPHPSGDAKCPPFRGIGSMCRQNRKLKG